MGSCGYELLPGTVRSGISGVLDDGLRGNLCSPCLLYTSTRTCSPHSIAAKEVEEKVFRAIHDQIVLVINLEHALAMIERLPSQSRKAFNYEAQIAKIEEEIERYQKLKLGLYENFIGGVIDKSEYFEFRNSYTKIIERCV